MNQDRRGDIGMTEGLNIHDGILISYTERAETITVPEGVHTIGEGAFKGCVSLIKVILPSSLRSIGPSAFKGCRRLCKIEIPEGVSYIGDYAFHRCHSLERIKLPTSVTELGDCVFLYCDSLIEAQLPGVRHLGKQVFVNDIVLQKITISRELQEDCICDEFIGCGQIKEIAFADGECFYIPTVVEVATGELSVPSLVQTIAIDILRMMELDGRCLVKFLTNLKHVELPEGIQRIGKSCFFDKRGILSVKLPKSLQEIEDRAFRNCINLEKIIFGKEQVCIHEDAFKNCSSLRQIETYDGKSWELTGIVGAKEEDVPSLVQTIHSQVLGNFRISGTILLKYLGEESRVVIPDGITIIAEEAFAGNEAIDRMILPESVQEIGAKAFKDCLLLQTIIFPDTIRRIGNYAFENCVKLIRIALPKELKKLEKGVFKRCQVLREITFGEQLKEIEEQAFYGCAALKELQFPEGMEVIGTLAFYRCKGLLEVTLLNNIEKVGALAFGESGVKKVTILASGKNYGNDLFFRCNRLRTVVFGDNVRHISDKFAYGCTKLHQVILPKSLVSVGKNVWENTPYLEQWKQKAQEAPEKIGSIFWDGSHLEGEVKLPDSIQILAGGAFYGNKKITSIYLPASIKWVGAAAFKGCSALTNVIWNCETNHLNAEVFSGCTNLETVETNIPWKTIKECAFYRCAKLQNICFDQVQWIGTEAFSGCKSLDKKLTKSFTQKNLWIEERAFEDTPILENSIKEPIIIENILVSAENCEGEICLPNGITAIAPFAFANNNKIIKVVLPDSLIKIGNGAFWGCESLETILFSENIQIIGAEAFEKCNSLKSVIIHATWIGSGAFSWCESLKYAELPNIRKLEARTFEGCIKLETCICEQAEKIDDKCFNGCESLAYFELQKVKEVGSYAFKDCDSLKQAVFQDGALLKPHAFEDCGRLEEITLIGDQGTICLREYAFSGCTALKLVRHQGKEYSFHVYRDILSEHLPEMVRLLFHSAMSCFVVKREENLCGYRGRGRILKIPEGIRRIEAEVFRDVLMLAKIQIPESVEYIGARAFHGTEWMRNQCQISPLVVVNQMLLNGCECTGEVVVPKEIRLVCGWAFANGMKIEKIRFQSERTRVEEYAFRNCIYLKEIELAELADGTCILMDGIEDRKKELPAIAKQAVMDRLNCFKTDEQGVLLECTGNLYHILLAKGITAIGESAFQDSNLLMEITFPDTVTEIRKGAFLGCKWLKTVQMAYSVEKIEDMAFANCGALEKIELSEKLLKIGKRAFENCVSLKEIRIPEGVEEIPSKAFYRCHSLKTLELPSTLKRIGKEAFAFCRGLEIVDMPKDVILEERAFVGCEKIKEMGDAIS